MPSRWLPTINIFRYVVKNVYLCTVSIEWRGVKIVDAFFNIKYTTHKITLIAAVLMAAALPLRAQMIIDTWSVTTDGVQVDNFGADG